MKSIRQALAAQLARTKIQENNSEEKENSGILVKHSPERIGYFSRDCPISSNANTRDFPSSTSREQNCYRCKKSGHISRDCPESTGSNNCYKCQKSGHLSRDCPESTDSKNCYRCQKPGHLSRDCTESTDSKNCYKCQKPGHLSRDCPESTDSKNCYKCQKPGHLSRDCPDSTGSNNCYKCQKSGHLSRDCPESTDSKNCYRCQKPGHLSRDCTESTGSNNCYKCQKPGHLSRDCTESTGSNNCYKCQKAGHVSRDCPERTEEQSDHVPMASFMPPDQNLSEIKKFINRGIRFEKYDRIQVSVRGKNAPEPITLFEEADLHNNVNKVLRECGFTRPTPVQKAAIPVIHGGKDLIACAETGSGKTAAFLLPIVSKMMKESECESVCEERRIATPRALILAPTRELVAQIHEHASLLTQYSCMHCAVLYGGLSVFKSKVALMKSGRCDILIATAGRFQDFLDKSYISLSELKYIIIDEGDRMLESPGFFAVIENVRNIIADCKQDVQTILFSATFPHRLLELANSLLKADNVFINVGQVGAANTSVSQQLILATKSEKEDLLRELIAENKDKKILVFCELKQKADYLGLLFCQILEDEKHVMTLHGDRTQEQRHFALKDFKEMDNFGLLITTSVAARGLDIPFVDIVINFDMPKEIVTYVHRIGRTGRCGMEGKSISFFDPEADQPCARALLRTLSGAQQPVPDWLEAMAEQSRGLEDFNMMEVSGGRKNQKNERIFDVGFRQTND